MRSAFVTIQNWSLWARWLREAAGTALSPFEVSHGQYEPIAHAFESAASGFASDKAVKLAIACGS
eukprot:9467224-Pyramimonas_sp.AAC.1